MELLVSAKEFSSSEQFFTCRKHCICTVIKKIMELLGIVSKCDSFFQMKLVSFGSDHPPTPSKWKCEKQNTDVL